MRSSKSETQVHSRDPAESVLGHLKIVVFSTDVVCGGDFWTHLLIATIGEVVPVANRIQVRSVQHMKKNRKQTWGSYIDIFKELGMDRRGLCSGSCRYIFLGAVTVGHHYWCSVQLSIGSNMANKFCHCAWDRLNKVLWIQLLSVLINQQKKKYIPAYLQTCSSSL